MKNPKSPSHKSVPNLSRRLPASRMCLTLLIIGSALTGFAPRASAALVGWWQFNEGSGTTMADASGNGLNASVVQGSPAWIAGKEGSSALDFPGNASVSPGTPTALNITGNMTVSAWVYPDNVGNSARVVGKQGTSTRGWSLGVENSTAKIWAFAVATSSSGLTGLNAANNSATAGVWQHVAGVYSGSPASLKIYVNGVDAAGVVSGTIPASQYNSTANQTRIGTRADGSLPFDGRIDDVRIYNHAMTQAELLESNTKYQSRTNSAGNWNAYTTWKTNRFESGAYTLVTASATPSDTSDLIQIYGCADANTPRSTVTVTANVTVDQMQMGGTFSYPAYPPSVVNVNSGVTLTVANGPNILGYDLACYGFLTNSGTITLNSGATIGYQSGAFDVHNQDNGTIPTAALWAAGAGTVNDPGATCEVRGSGPSSPSGMAQAFRNLVINNPGNTVTLTGGPTVTNLTVVAGTLDMAQYGITNKANVGALSVSNGATLKMPGTWAAIVYPVGFNALNLGASSTLDYARNDGGAQTVAAIGYGNLTISGSGTKSLLGAATSAGDLNVSAGTLDLGANTITRSPSGGTFTLANGATLRMSAQFGYPLNFNTASIGATSTMDYARNDGGVQQVYGAAHGNMTFSGSGTKYINSSAATALGNVTLTGTVIVTNSVAWTNSGSASIGSGTSLRAGQAMSLNQATVDTGGSLVVESGQTLTVPTSLAVNGTSSTYGILNCAGTGIVNGGGSVSINSGALFYIGSASGISSSGASGSIQNTGARNFSSDALYTYAYASVPAVTGNGLPSSIRTLGTPTTGQLTLSQSLTVNGNATWNGLILYAGGGLAIGANTLTLNNGVSLAGTLTGGGSSDIIVGGSGIGPVATTLPAVISGLRNLTVNRTANYPTLGGAVTVNNTLTLTSGTLTNGANLTLGNGATISRDTGSLNSVPTFGTSVNVSYTGTTQVTSGNELPAAPTVLNNLTVDKSGGVIIGASRTVNGTLTLSSGAVTSANNLTLANGVTISRAAGSLSGTPTFGTSANVIYTGSVTTGTELPTSSSVLSNLTVNGSGITVTLGAGPTVNGTLALTDGALSANGNDVAANILSGTGTLNNAGAAKTLTVGGGGGSSAFGGVISGALALTKSGAGTLTLSGANLYTGNTTVSAGGTLALSGSGSLANSPVIAVAGTATLDVTGRTDGWTLGSGQTLTGSGTVLGNVAVSGNVAAGSSPGTLTVTGNLTNNPGGQMTVELTSTNTYDVVNVSGVIDVQATSGSPFTNKLVAANLTDFDKDLTNTFTIATASSVANFAADKFVVDDTSFTNDLAGGTFTTEEGSLKVKFTPNHAPTADATNYTRAKNTSLKIPLPDLITTRAADADAGQTVFLHHLRSANGVNKTANNYTVTTNASYILYTNATDNTSDTLEYVVLDTASYRAGDSKRYATGTISIAISDSLGTVTITNSTGNEMILGYFGIPGYTNVLQRSCLDLESWVDIETSTVPASGPSIGYLQFTNTPGCNPAFYRVRSE